MLAVACQTTDAGPLRVEAGPGTEAAAPSNDAPASSPDPVSPTGEPRETGSAGPGCAPPREGASCSGDEMWARNPQTRECCPYSSPCAVPWDWALFASESECQTSCRCADVTPSDYRDYETSGVATFATERTDFECFCPDGSCRPQETLDEALGTLCAEGGGSWSTLLRGCGMVMIRSASNFVGSERVFDRDTGAAIGVTQWSDVPQRPCWAYTIVIGREFACEDATECVLCAGDAGAASGGLPACD